MKKFTKNALEPQSNDVELTQGGGHNYLKYALFIFLFSLTVFSTSAVITFAAFSGGFDNNFTVEYSAPKPATLVTGQEFCKALKVPGNSSASYGIFDMTVKSITFDYYGTKYNNVVNNASVVTDVATDDSVRDALMYHVGNSTNGYDVYVLSSDDIVANFDSSFMFYYLVLLKSITFNNFDTNKVSTVSSMFKYSENITLLDLRSWDMSNVTDMSDMFSLCCGLAVLNVDGWDTSSVTSMSGIFGCSEDCPNNALTVLDLSTWDTSNVTDMSSMFKYCSGLTALDLGNFDTSKVTDMSYMFEGCRGLSGLDVSNFDTSSVTDMSHTFGECTGLSTLDLSTWDTSGVRETRYMFFSCSGLTAIYIGSGWNTSKVTIGGDYMFLGCTSLPNYDSSYVTHEYCSRYMTYV